MKEFKYFNLEIDTVKCEGELFLTKELGIYSIDDDPKPITFKIDQNNTYNILKSFLNADFDILFSLSNDVKEIEEFKNILRDICKGNKCGVLYPSGNFTIEFSKYSDNNGTIICLDIYSYSIDSCFTR